MSAKREYTCQRCGKRFTDYAIYKRVYCSRECAQLVRRKELPGCEVCGRRVQRSGYRHCSPQCRDVAEGHDKQR